MKKSLVRSLGLTDTLALVIGTIIGTGVFLKTAIMAQTAGSATWVLAAWAVAGVISLAGALSYAELGSLFPHAGGEYVYLKEGYGPLMGFLYGWGRFWIGSPGTIAAYAVGAATFMNGLVPLPDGILRVSAAMFFILLFTLVNCCTVAFSGKLQTYLTYLKVFMILGLTIVVFSGAKNASWNFLLAPESSGWAGFSAFGSAVLAALWAYDGWNSMPMAAGEIKNPEKVIPKALGLGLLFIFVIYALTNLAYFYALPFGEILTANSSQYPEALPVATKAAYVSLGSSAVLVLSAAFVFSAVGAMNGGILTGARVPYAMANDGLFFKVLSRLHQKTLVPVPALIVQGLWSCVLAASGSFDQLTNYVVFSSFIFYGLSTGAVFILRRKHPNMKRSFHTPLYPWLPGIFLVSTVFLLINTLITSTQESIIGILFIASGIPMFYLFKRSSGA